MLPRISIKGSPEELGFQHGDRLAEKINNTIEFYAKVSGDSHEDILSKARYFKQKIKEYNYDYVREIEALSEGANINSLWIYALNSRTEILSISPNECTAIYFQKTGILGQNWDWARALEDSIVLMEIEQPNDHKILTITEPGIIGKIGMNSSGLGVCLNILMIDKELNGVPIHILLRSILDSKTIEEAKENVKKAGLGKASNILVANGEGECFNVEFAGDRAFYLTPENQILVHTNHFLARQINPERGIFRSSYARMRTAKEKLESSGDRSLESMKNILLDRSNKDMPINQRYIPFKAIGNLGTICTIIMDLKNLEIHIKKGANLEDDFQTIKLQDRL